jgi:hypothetical protein
MLEVRPTPIQSSYVKGCTFIAGRIRRSRRDTPSFHGFHLESGHSAFGHFPPPGCFAPMSVT